MWLVENKHQPRREAIADILGVCFDVISILVSAGAISAGARGLLLIAAIADITMAGVDLAVRIKEVKSLLEKTDAGKWFLKNWEEIYFVGGVLMVSPVIAKGIIINGPELVSFLAKQTAEKASRFAQLIENLIVNIKVELYLASAGKNLLFVFEPFAATANLFGSYIAKQMRDLGVLLAKTGDGDLMTLVYKGEIIAEGKATELRETLTRIFKRKGPDLVKFLDTLAEIGVLKFSQRSEEHLVKGQIKMQIVSSKINKKFPDGSLNPAWIIEKYEYVPGFGRSPKSIKKGQNFDRVSEGGAHIINKLDNRFVRIKRTIDTKKIASGETVRIVELEYWIEELGHWVTKEDIHTFWPQSWSVDKIKRKILEASENVIKKKGNQIYGTTNDGIDIIIYYDVNTKEISTAYINF